LNFGLRPDFSVQLKVSLSERLSQKLKSPGVLISAGIWYQKKPVRHLHDTRTRNQRQKVEFIYGVRFWSVCRVPRFICMCVLASSVSVWDFFLYYICIRTCCIIV